MKCDRCSSAMVYQKFCGAQEQFWGWRCIFCGEIIDEVILRNRVSPKVGAATNVRARGR